MGQHLRAPAPVRVAATAAVVAALAASCSTGSGARQPAAPSGSAVAAQSAGVASSAAPAPGEPAGALHTLPAAQAERLDVALTAAPGHDVVQSLAPQLRASYSGHPFPLLPAGSEVSVHAGEMKVHGATATVPAVVTGGPAAGRWLLLLVNVDGQWLLYGTSKP